MIVTKKVKVKMNGKHISKYRNMGYECNVGDIIEVNIDDLPIKSKLEIEVCCDYCGNQKIVKYYTYSKSISLGKYSCSKCTSIKIKENNLKKYGVDSTNKLESTINKKKKTCFVKYGNYFNIEKVEKTKMEKYGDAKYNNREKAKKTIIEKYGVDNYRKTEEYKTKNKETNLKKYGVEHYSQNPIIFRKQQLGGFMAKKYGELYYRGKYELDFIKYCEKNTIQITNGPSLHMKWMEFKKYIIPIIIYQNII